MKKSISTLLKHSSKDKINRSANPAVVRASTILFDSMQEIKAHEKKILNNKKITHYTYGRYGSQTTIELENISKELSSAMESIIKFDYKVDQDLIGGLKLQLGSFMIDTSIKNKLKKYEQEMIEN